MSNTDNFDSPEGMEPDLNTDLEFDEFENNKDKSISSSLKSSPLIKFGLIGAAILVVIILISLFGGDAVEAPPSFVGKGAGDNFKEAPGTKEVTPVMKEALEEKNDQMVDDAQRQGISAIPTPIDPPKTLLETTNEDSQAEDPLLRWQQMQLERAKAQREQDIVQDRQGQTDPQREGKVTSLATAMSTQMSEILGKDKEDKLQHMVVFELSSLANGQGGEGVGSGNQIQYGGGTGNPQIGKPEPTKPANIIVSAGKIEYAQMILEANSDIPGPVVALMASGKFAGSKLLGKFTNQEEYLVITFDMLVTKKGTSIPIKAYAIDPGTSLTGVATDVDHRYFKRIILPAAAKFVEGLGEAYAETTTSTTQGVAGTTTTSTDLDTKQELGKAVSEMAQSVGEILSEDGKSTKPLVIVAAGTPLGILFMDSITDKQILQSRAGLSTAAGMQNGANQGQVQQNQMNMNQNQPMTTLQQIQQGLQNQQFLDQGGAMNSPNNGTK